MKTPMEKRTTELTKNTEKMIYWRKLCVPRGLCGEITSSFSKLI